MAPRVVGIDPGTVSFDLCGLHDRRVFLDRAIPTRDVAAEPGRLAEELSALGPLDLIAGPSGYGLPLTPINRLSDQDIALAFLPDPRSRSQSILGLRQMIAALRDADLPIVLTPGVIHVHVRGADRLRGAAVG